MNLLPRATSLTRKMKLVMMAVSTLAVLTAGLASIYLSYLNYRANLISDLQGLARVVGRNCQVALKFNLAGDAEQVLAAFEARPTILFAAVYDASGNLFAAYDPAGRYAKMAKAYLNMPETGWAYHEGHLHVVVPIRLGQEALGTLLISDTMSAIYTAMTRHVFILLCVMVLAIGLAYILTTRLQGLIVGPVLALSRTATRISQEKNYALRAVKQSDDETGRLIDSFNELIESVQRHEADLRSAYATVRAREQELQATNEQLLAQEQQLKSANRDLVESREQLALLATAIEQAEEGICLSDVQGRYTYANSAYGRITGYAPAELIGRTPAMLRDPSQSDESIRDITATTERGETWKGVVNIIKKGGESIDIEMSSTPIRNAAGEMTCYVAIIRDISRERLLEQQMQQAQKMEAIGTLAGGIAHDFNNILSAIIGFTEIACYSDNMPDNIRGNLDNVLRASDRAKDLVQQILTFSRMGNQEKKPVSLKPIVKEGLKLLRASIPSTIEIRSRIENDAAIMADPTQMHQVLMNLCTNAAHAMAATGGVLDIGLKNAHLDAGAAAKNPDAHPGRHICLTVSDTGAGMDPAVLDKIFEPFFTTKEQGRGTGLGLSVVHGIVKSHGGAITVASEQGRGSTFRIYLPVIERDADERTAHEGAIPGGTERILLVDDEEMVLAVGKRYLESLGYTVAAFAGGSQALQAFADNPAGYDLLITDYTMPRMTGYDLARDVLRLRPDMPVVLCTGFSETISAQMAKEAGIRDFLLKPLNRAALAKAVRRALGSRKP